MAVEINIALAIRTMRTFGKGLTCWTGVSVSLGVIDKILFDKKAAFCAT